MKIKMILTVLLFCLVVNVSEARYLKEGALACFSKPKYDEMYKAIGRSDRNHVNYLIKSGSCMITNQNLDISILDNGWTNAKVRAYTPSGESAILYTAIENLGK